MQVIYHGSDFSDLTPGKKYDVLSLENDEYGECVRLFIINDNGEQKCYKYNEYCKIFWNLTGKYIKCINTNNGHNGTHINITLNSIYELIDEYISEDYIFIGDENKFSSIRKQNYLGGEKIFEEVNWLDLTQIDTEKLFDQIDVLQLYSLDGLDNMIKHYYTNSKDYYLLYVLLQLTHQIKHKITEWSNLYDKVKEHLMIRFESENIVNKLLDDITKKTYDAHAS
jgi:hypothetical protein